MVEGGRGMSEKYRYQVNGFELGPVPAVEVARLLRKGRVAPDTPVRPEAGGEWTTAERLGGSPRNEPNPAPAPNSSPGATPGTPWHLVLLDRFAALGVPLGVALMVPWERPGFAAGALTLSVFAGALAKAAAGLAIDAEAARRAKASD